MVCLNFSVPVSLLCLPSCIGGGIGRATGRIFAREGAAGVAFADINLEAAKSAAEESQKHATNPHYKAIHIHVDVADESSVNNMVKVAVDAFGALHYAVNSAGVSFTNKVGSVFYSSCFREAFYWLCANFV